MEDKTLSSELSRELGLFPITMMGLGMMIGAGVFLGLGNSIFVAGPGGGILTFALNGVLAMFTAMAYAELSSAIPRAGGAYNYARLGFGRGTSFVAGWMEWFASSVAGSLYAVTFGIYIVRYLEGLGIMAYIPLSTTINEKIIAIMAASLFLYINYKGASETGKVGSFCTLGQTLFLIFIGLVGIFMALKDPSRLQNFKPFLPNGWSKLLVTMGFTYVAFEGFEVIAQTGDEAIDPRKNLPKAMFYSVYIVTITYIIVSFATIVAVKAGSPGINMPPWQWIGQFKERGFGEAIARLMPMGNLLLTLAVIFAATSALNATIYSATRASYALGRDHMLPKFFAKISKKRKTPWVALSITGGLIILVATVLPTMDVASSASIMFLLLFFMVNICVIKIRVNMADELTYGYVMPFFPLFPIIAIICQGILAVWLVHMSLIAWIIAPVWIFSGIAIYHFYSKSRVITSEGEIQILEEEKAPEGDEYKIMVSVANPQNALQMVRTTYMLCGAKKARVELLHMVPVPAQTPLTDLSHAEEYMMEGKEAIVETMLYLAPLFPLSTTVRYCRNIARGIISAIREKKTDMLIIGWHGRPKTYGFRFGSTVDPIIERAPCNVVILKDTGNRKFKNILVPIAGGPNGAFALEVASILAGKEDGKIVTLSVYNKERSFNLEEFINEQQDKLSISKERIHTKTIQETNIAKAIIEEGKNYDLIVLGYTQMPKIHQVTKASIPETVAQNCQTPLLIVKASGGLRSFIKRWI